MNNDQESLVFNYNENIFNFQGTKKQIFKRFFEWLDTNNIEITSFKHQTINEINDKISIKEILERQKKF